MKGANSISQQWGDAGEDDQLAKDLRQMEVPAPDIPSRQGGRNVPVGATHPPVSLDTLPAELVDRIFSEAVFVPHHSYDPSSCQGSNNPWLRLLRMKKDLSRICKATYWPGMRVLYGDIVLRRMGQISALARTLRSPEIGKALGEIVRVVRIDSCPVLGSCAGAIEEDLVWILTRFITLRSFSYHPHPQFCLTDAPYNRKAEGGVFNPIWFFQRTSQVHIQLASHTGPRLRNLDLSIDLRDDSMLCGIHSILMNATSLVTLRLARYDYPILTDMANTSPAGDYPESMVNLPYLSELTIDLSMRKGLQTYACARWRLPSLTHLTLLPGEGGDSRDTVAQVLECFGIRLLYLQLLDGTLEESFFNLEFFPWIASNLDALCPEIQHLVLTMFFSTPPLPLDIRSKTLRWLDIWVYKLRTSIQDGPPIEEWTQSTVCDALVGPASITPSLVGVRMLLAPWAIWPRGAISIRGADWPRICSPDLLEAGAPEERRGYIVHRFPTRWIVQTALAILPFDDVEMPNVVAMLGGQEAVVIDELLHWTFGRRELRHTEKFLAREEMRWQWEHEGYCENKYMWLEQEGESDDSDYEDGSENETEDGCGSEGEPEEEYLEDDIEEEEIDTEVVDREAILDAFSRIQPSCGMYE